MRLTRRDFVLRVPLALAGVATLGAWLPGVAAAAEDRKPARPQLPRPRGTCGGWVDRQKDGSCDRSEGVEKRCNALQCPGHKDNARRAEATKNGAPQGTCAAWEGAAGKSTCTLSQRSENPCLYTACVAHAKKAGGHKAGDSAQI